MSEPIIRNAEDIFAIFPTLSPEERISTASKILDMCVETDSMLLALKDALSEEEKQALRAEVEENLPVAEAITPSPETEAQFAVYVSLGIAETGLGHRITVITREAPDTFTFSAENEAMNRHLQGAVARGVVEKLILLVIDEACVFTEYPIEPPTKEAFLAELAKHP